MSTFAFFVAFTLLIVGVWAFVAVSLWYGRELLKRQHELIELLLPYLQQKEKTKKLLTISKDELLEKYRELTLPEQVQVNFQEKEKEK